MGKNTLKEKRRRERQKLISVLQNIPKDKRTERQSIILRDLIYDNFKPKKLSYKNKVVKKMEVDKYEDL
jgi:hypothetical protein